MKTIIWEDPMKLNDESGKLSKNIAENWLIGLRETNPAILDMFHERDKKPYRELLPWSGEFAGKYITGAYYIYKLTRHGGLYSYMSRFLDELLSCIDEDGYIGCFQKECRLTGAYSQNPTVSGSTWDAWSHYHIMFGLYLWHRETKNSRYQEAVIKIAELFMKTFYHGNRRIVEIGSTEMNLSVIHIFALLYRDTKDERYLKFALEIETDIKHPNAGNYIEYAIEGGEFYKCPKPRWESLHVVMGIAALSDVDEKYKKAALQIFYSILKTDIHNTGGFSTEEQAMGTPFINGVIELCCVIAYNSLACDILKITGDLKIVDFLELSHYNAVMGSFSPTGRWSTYNTPMEGAKLSNYHQIGFQCRPGSPDLNCCSVNAVRGVGLLSEWAVTENGGTTYINYFGSWHGKTKDGLNIRVSGDYPANGNVTITLDSHSPKRVAVRIPAWSKNTLIKYADKEIIPASGEYWEIEKEWKNSEINIEFDFTPYWLEGGGNYTGKCSIYTGPVLYGYDLSMNDGFDFEHLPAITAAMLQKAVPERNHDGRIILKLKNGMTLCDFYRLGSTGGVYKTWFSFNNK